MEAVQGLMAAFAAFVISLTGDFVNTSGGQAFLSLSLVGPITFLPTVWQAWRAPNIDALRTWTWPLMVIVNLAVLVSVCHNGDWQIQLSMILWVLLMMLITLAIVVRRKKRSTSDNSTSSAT